MGQFSAGAGGAEGGGAGEAQPRFSPWRHIGDKYPDWIVELGDLGGLTEAMCVKDRVILIDRHRSRDERRCDLTHAIAHIELGHRDRRNKHDEAAAVRLAAKLLIDLEPLGDALSASSGLVDEYAAGLLEVDIDTLTARLRHLHPAERGYLRRRLAHLATGAA